MVKDMMCIHQSVPRSRSDAKREVMLLPEPDRCGKPGTIGKKDWEALVDTEAKKHFDSKASALDSCLQRADMTGFWKLLSCALEQSFDDARRKIEPGFNRHVKHGTPIKKVTQSIQLTVPPPQEEDELAILSVAASRWVHVANCYTSISDHLKASKTNSYACWSMEAKQALVDHPEFR